MKKQTKDKIINKERVRKIERNAYSKLSNIAKNSEDRYEIGELFVKQPKTFLENLGLSFKDISCPKEAHSAFELGEEFSCAVKKIKFKNNEDRLTQSYKLAQKFFGEDVKCELVPFGVKFKERMKMSSVFDDDMPQTATASCTITFCDVSSDVDE